MADFGKAGYRLLSIDVKFYQFWAVTWLVDEESRDGRGSNQSLSSSGRGERGQTQNSVFLVNIWIQLGCITILARIKHTSPHPR